MGMDEKPVSVYIDEVAWSKTPYATSWRIGELQNAQESSFSLFPPPVSLLVNSSRGAGKVKDARSSFSPRWRDRWLIIVSSPSLCSVPTRLRQKSVFIILSFHKVIPFTGTLSCVVSFCEFLFNYRWRFLFSF